MSNAVIELDQVCLGWRDRVAVRDVTGSFERGSLTAIVGPNGAGKSTLIKGIMGLVSPVRGRIRLGREASEQMAGLPHLGELDRSLPVTTYDLVAMGAWKRTGAWKGYGDAGHDRVHVSLACVGLADFGPRIIGTLSADQLQRALFARLMFHDAGTFLLDAPIAAVDRPHIEDLMALLEFWHGEGRTVI